MICYARYVRLACNLQEFTTFVDVQKFYLGTSKSHQLLLKLKILVCISKSYQLLLKLKSFIGKFNCLTREFRVKLHAKTDTALIAYRFSRKIICTFYLFGGKLKEMKCPSKSTESLTSWVKVFISSFAYMTVDSSTSSVVAQLLRLVWLNFCLPFSGPCSQDFLAFSLSRAKEVFYASSRICSLFQNGENFWLALKNALLVFGSSKVTMVLKTL